MARRRSNSTGDDMFDAARWLFTVIHPAWSIVVAATFFLGAHAVFRFAIQQPEWRVFANLGGGMLALVCLIGGLAGWIERRRRRQFFATKVDLDRIRALSWQEFERRVGDLFRGRGYSVEETGGGGADGGVDLRLHRNGETTLVQCKQWRVYKVGVRPVRELFGVMAAEGADRALLICSGVYTEEARRFAEAKPVELIDGRQLAEMFRDVQSACQNATSATPASPTLPEAASTPAVPRHSPACPRCGSAMVLRTARRGQNVGGQFWGCSHYPACKGTQQCDPAEVEAELRRS